VGYPLSVFNKNSTLKKNLKPGDLQNKRECTELKKEEHVNKKNLEEGRWGALDHPPWGAVLRFGGRPFPDVGLRGSPDPDTCEDCHRDQLTTAPLSVCVPDVIGVLSVWISNQKKHKNRRHQPRLVTGSLWGPKGPRRDGGPAEGLIELEVSSLGGSGLCHHQCCTQRAGWAWAVT